jgi:hypothetical protein
MGWEKQSVGVQDKIPFLPEVSHPFSAKLALPSKHCLQARQLHCPSAKQATTKIGENAHDASRAGENRETVR